MAKGSIGVGNSAIRIQWLVVSSVSSDEVEPVDHTCRFEPGVILYRPIDGCTYDSPSHIGRKPLNLIVPISKGSPSLDASVKSIAAP